MLRWQMCFLQSVISMSASNRNADDGAYASSLSCAPQESAQLLQGTRLADVFVDTPYNRSNFLLVSSSHEQVPSIV